MTPEPVTDPQDSPLDGSSPIYLASFPRSGNTYLRTILFHCFGLQSGSVYPDDFRGNEQLASVTGHVELDVAAPPAAVPLIKTHRPPPGPEPAIYIVRNGLDACLSLHDFVSGRFSLKDIVTGANPHGSWSDHVRSWAPTERPATLFLRYENMVADPGATIEALAGFLRSSPIRARPPARDAIADGRWIRKRRETREPVPPRIVDLFEAHNGPIMRLLGYEA